VEPPDRVPVQADLPLLLDEGLRMVGDRLRASPDFPIYLSIQRQLEYLQATAARGQSPDPEKIDSLTLGVYAAREFETSDPDFADVLFKVHYLANRMP
jgi:Tsi6